MPNRLLPSLDDTYTIVLASEKTGRILKKVNGLSAHTAQKIVNLADATAEISGAVFDLVGAAARISDALEPLTRAPRKLPPRRRR